MSLEIESRPSDSPYIRRVWRSRSVEVSRMRSIACSTWDLVFWQHYGRVFAAVRGPESAASLAPVPEDATFFGINLALGASVPHLPVTRLVDGAIEMPTATHGSFWLKGSAWRRPDYENAEAFVQRMVREGVVARDPIVAAVLRGASPRVSERTIQRRFAAATGLTPGAVRQIERARRAAALIQEGVAASDVVHRLGYFDQPHLARALTRYVGRTATRLSAPEPVEPLSLLYKT